MIRYQQYLDFEAGKIDMYDVAEERVWCISLWDFFNFPLLEKEQFSYELFQKCDAVTICFRYEENTSLQICRRFFLMEYTLDKAFNYRG